MQDKGNEISASENISKEKRIFEQYSVPKAVAAMVLPTIISQIVLVIYNMADTWYVGRTDNADAVAAVSLCLPVYSILSAISNLFGIGAASVIARALGTGDRNKAAKAFAVASWGALITALVYSVIIFFSAKPLLMLIGGDGGDIGYAVAYTRWTVVIGAVPTTLAAVFAHMVRAVGAPKKASFGMIFGAVLNILLDPLFMFVILPPGNEVVGAASATAVSNLAGFLFFCIYIVRNRSNGIFSFNIFAKSSVNVKCFTDIVKAGLPGFAMLSLAMLSNCFFNSMLSPLGSAAIAGVGIVKKIDQLAYAVNQGVTQGMLPLVAYCFSSNRLKRMKSVIRFSSISSEIFSFLCVAVSVFFAPLLVSVFIKNSDTVYYGTMFLRVMCLGIPLYTISFVVMAVFQAVGKGVEPFIIAVINKGTIDIALMFLIRDCWKVSEITWATPVSNAIAMIVALIMLIRFLQSISASEKANIL